MRISNLKTCITVSLKMEADANRLVTKWTEEDGNVGTQRNE
jgi:hypothetical protein